MALWMNPMKQQSTRHHTQAMQRCPIYRRSEETHEDDREHPKSQDEVKSNDSTTTSGQLIIDPKIIRQ